MNPSGPPERALLDQRGCLTPAGLAALARAPIGRGPAELAAHLASCARCQERMLASGAGPRPAPSSAPRRKPRLWLGLLLAAAALVLALAALILLIKLGGAGGAPPRM
jgi:hypothetical protein